MYVFSLEPQECGSVEENTIMRSSSVWVPHQAL